MYTIKIIKDKNSASPNKQKPDKERAASTSDNTDWTGCFDKIKTIKLNKAITIKIISKINRKFIKNKKTNSSISTDKPKSLHFMKPTAYLSCSLQLRTLLKQ